MINLILILVENCDNARSKKVVEKVEECLSHNNNLEPLQKVFEEADIFAKELTNRSKFRDIQSFELKIYD